jgi:hypothetical protein
MKSRPPDVVHESTTTMRSTATPSPSSCLRASTALRYVPERRDDMVMHSTSDPRSSTRLNSSWNADWNTASVLRILALRKRASYFSFSPSYLSAWRTPSTR